MHRFHRESVDAAGRRHAGVADQSNDCENGTPGCPGPDAPTGTLPCTECFLNGGDGS